MHPIAARIDINGAAAKVHGDIAAHTVIAGGGIKVAAEHTGRILPPESIVCGRHLPRAAVER